MRLWPWRGESRAIEDDDSSPLVRAVLAKRQAAIEAGTVAAVETCASAWQRAFMAAMVTPSTPATRLLTPRVIGMAARALAVQGESLWYIATTPDGIELLPVATFDVAGGASPATWRYTVDVATPNGDMRSRRVAAEQVIHWRYSAKPSEPWRGMSPLDHATTTQALAKAIEHELRQEFDGPVGTVLFGGGGELSDQEALDQFVAHVKALNGGVTVATADRGSSTGFPHENPTTSRIGPTPPASIGEIRDRVANTIYAAFGLPPALVNGGSAGAQREGYRQFLHGLLTPLGLSMAEEAAAKLATPDLAFDFSATFAADIASRARAYAGLVKAGMDAAKAERLAGFA